METDMELNITDLGYKPFFESNRNSLGLAGYSVARVICEFKEAYKVKNTNGERFAKITGKQMFEASSREDYPAVGDWVAITELEDDRAVIHAVLPRLTEIKRKYGDRNKAGDKDEIQIVAANIDVAFVVEAVDRDYNLNRFERYFAIAENGGVKPAIILNKIDLLSRETLNELFLQLGKRFPAVDVIPTSAVNGEGLDALKRYIAKGKTYCFLGSSGVGKSSLINTLLGESAIKTGDVSSHSGRGKHVTTGRQMYFLENGGIVIDNPGMREVGMSDVNQGIDAVFNDITALAQQCKYTNCTHIHEPGCAVVEALKSGKLDEEKYSNYLNLKKEAEYYEMNDVEKREKDRQFGKHIKRIKKELRDIGHKYH
jgi:ribosome biogenesis GTPase / thiamine phosphate phosphatase